MDKCKPRLPLIVEGNFLKELAIYFEEDPEPIKNIWHWKKFIQQYPHLRPKVEKYLEEATTGDPAYAMHCMVCDCGSSREWAEREIPKVKVGNPAEVMFYMVRDCGSSREWAEREIPKVKVGNPTWAMYFMVCYCGSPREWAEKEIPKVRVGDVDSVIRYMIRLCGSSEEWYKKAKEENKKWKELGLNYLN